MKDQMLWEEETLGGTITMGGEVVLDIQGGGISSDLQCKDEDFNDTMGG